MAAWRLSMAQRVGRPCHSRRASRPGPISICNPAFGRSRLGSAHKSRRLRQRVSFQPLFWPMEPGHEIPVLPGEPRLISQIKEFAGFPSAKCTYSRRESIGDFQCISRGRAEGVSVIRSSSAGTEAHRVVSFRGAETHTRSVLKAVSWRTLGTLDTFAISWLLTGRVAIAGSIAALEIATKIVWYYLHERIWAAIHWGRRHH